MTKRIICVDFDGTCVTHKYPYIGDEIGATEVLKELVAVGHKIILFTMRSGELLDEAVAWFAEREIPLFGINSNPTQFRWTKSPKPHCNMIIDDISCGIPLKYDGSRNYVDWTKVREVLVSSGYLQ